MLSENGQRPQQGSEPLTAPYPNRSACHFTCSAMKVAMK